MQISVCARRFSSFYSAVEIGILELGIVIIEEMETITSVSSQLFSIKTLPNVGSELLGIQENQKDAEPRQKEKGRWYKTGVSRITRHSKDTAQCRSRITRHSRGPKGRQFQK